MAGPFGGSWEVGSRVVRYVRHLWAYEATTCRYAEPSRDRAKLRAINRTPAEPKALNLRSLEASADASQGCTPAMRYRKVGRVRTWSGTRITHWVQGLDVWEAFIRAYESLLNF